MKIGPSLTRVLATLSRTGRSQPRFTFNIRTLASSADEPKTNNINQKRPFFTSAHHIPSYSANSEHDPNKASTNTAPSKILQALAGKLDSLQLGESSSLNHVEKVGADFDTSKLLYAEALQQTANKYAVVIGLRLPSAQGQIHLQEGHPTKNFHVKAKSSNTGPTAGFIPAKALYSKVSISQQEKHDKNVQNALAKGANLMDLKLSQKQIDVALATGAMVKTSEGHYLATYHGTQVNFSISPTDNIVREADGSPVQVLTNPPEIDTGQKTTLPFPNKPITADYDLFSITPRANQSVNIRPVEVGHKLTNRLSHLEQDELSGMQNDYPLEEGAKSFDNAVKAFTESRNLENEDINQGNLHHFGRVIIDDINKNAAKDYKGGKLVWHSDEVNNPFSQGFDPADSPVFFIPNQSPQQIFTKEELIKFNQALKNAGFSPDLSPRFGI